MRSDSRRMGSAILVSSVVRKIALYMLHATCWMPMLRTRAGSPCHNARVTENKAPPTGGGANQRVMVDVREGGCHGRALGRDLRPGGDARATKYDSRHGSAG